MTTQLRDTVQAGGKAFALTGCTHRLFDPAVHGIEVDGLSSACWWGHRCDYRVDEAGQLSLTRLTLYVPQGQQAPPLRGWRAQPLADDPFGTHVYEGLSLPVPPFDGVLLLGNRPYRELIFLAGRLARTQRRWSMPLELSAV
jgi:hypothetical protein